MESHVPLATLTSLAVGGPAEQFVSATSTEALLHTITQTHDQPLWLLGYGANVLISDAGLPGTTMLVRTSHIERDGDTVIADAGVWWDDLVQFAIEARLWGLELMSAIPGGVGAAIVGNIAAYGQAVADTLSWVEVYDRSNRKTKRLTPNDLSLSYRYSAFQTDPFKKYVILRVAFTLRQTPAKAVEYQVALDVANSKGYELDSLEGRRHTILDTRQEAGSLWDYRTPGTQMHTAGSFFRNPMVSDSVAERLMAFDETGRTAENLRKMNQVHGGAGMRVSAAHVLLAAGFKRGQTWGPVRLHPDHILKIENTGGASAQQIYNVSQEIIQTVKENLDIDLVPEVRFLGTFEANRE